MADPISEGHSIRRLFGTLAEKSFYERLGWPDGRVIQYISDLLVDFVDIQNVYQVRAASGKPLKEVAEMLYESQAEPTAGPRDRTREVHRHIGDYTLFMMGIFPEYLKRLKATGLISNPDVLMDYVKVGKRSYRIVSEFSTDRSRDFATLFRKLSEHFELCVMGLAYIRKDLDRLRHPGHAVVRRILLN